MKIRTFLIVFLSVLCLTSCQTAAENVTSRPDTSIEISAPEPLTQPTSEPITKTNKNSSIRKIDFENFTFPWTRDQGAPDTFTLKNGKKERRSYEDIEATFNAIEYGDVTGDDTEEALLSIYPWSGGNCSCHMVYIYTLRNGTPTLLWSFDTWDKAQGGFKRTYAENGQLVVELFGDNKFEDGEWSISSTPGKFKGLCCPTTFTRIRFRWDGSQFKPATKPEVFDYDYKPNK